MVRRVLSYIAVLISAWCALLSGCGSGVVLRTANSSAPEITIATTALDFGTVDSAYSQTLLASGGTPSYSWSVTAGILPAGLSLAATGVLSGTPTAAGSFSFTVTVTDSGSPAQSRSAALSILVEPAALTITSTSLATGTVGSAYSQTLLASGGTPSYNWSVTAGSLPAGLSLAAGGVLSGTPTAAGSFSFTVTVTDSGSPAQSRSAALSILVKPVHDVVLHWDPPASKSDPVAGYNIYRATGAGAFVLLNPVLDPQVSYTDSSVLSGATYTYAVKSVDYSNIESVRSNQVTVTIP
jgi:Putative Ig domain